MGYVSAAQIPVMVVPDPLHMSMERVEIAEIDGLPLLRARIPVIAGIDGSVKRAFDLVVAMIALIVFAIPIMLIALRLRLKSNDAVFSRSVRVGRNGTLFDELSFRSIGESSETSSLSLDFSGLPRIFNLLRGDLSIVGPLAQKPESVAQYEEWHRARLMATPGVTGLWRIRASEEMTFAEMVLLDLFYAEHWSIWLDLRIVMRSIGHLAGSPAGQQTVYRDAPATSPQ